MKLIGMIGSCRFPWLHGGIEMGTWRIWTGPRSPLSSGRRPTPLPCVLTAIGRILDGKMQSYLGAFVSFPQPMIRPISDPLCSHSVLVVQQEPVYHKPACSESPLSLVSLLTYLDTPSSCTTSSSTHFFVRGYSCDCDGLGFICDMKSWSF